MNESLLAFQKLHADVQPIVYRLGFTTLRPIQILGINAYYESHYDLLLLAPTAGGKTEAWLLPALSDLVSRRLNSVQVLVVSPLKALINDQAARISKIAEPLNIRVTAWHGDIAQDKKQSLVKNPRGILIQTPESLEALVMNHPGRASKIFKHLQLVVIDEVHAMLEEERGIHVRSLLSRLFDLIQHRPRMIGLSATIADPKAAQIFLNPDNPDTVQVLGAEITNDRELQVGLCAFLEKPGERESALEAIAQDIADVAMETSNLVFANSRRVVEWLSARLHQIAKERGMPYDPFISHHGSLSKEVRERTEKMLKSGKFFTAIATSSLELGIDIGAVGRVFQVDPPWTVSAEFQRTGRCGRRDGDPTVYRLATRDRLPIRESSLSALLFPGFLQGHAMIELLVEGKLEPPGKPKLHLSTLVHQTLSCTRQWGAVPPERLYQILCEFGPFRNVDPELYADVLRSLKSHGLIAQGSDGAIVLGEKGDQITSKYDFYAAFNASEDYTVRFNENTIGLLPASELPKVGQYIILDGRRWLVGAKKHREKIVEVTPAQAGSVTPFGGDIGDVHTIVFKRMQAILTGSVIPGYLDPEAVRLLRSARETAQSAGLTERTVLVGTNIVLWFPWIGTKALRTLRLFAKLEKLECADDGLCLSYKDLGRDRLVAHLTRLTTGKVDPTSLAALLDQKQLQKFDLYLEEAILDRANGNDRLDMDGAREAAAAALLELEHRV